MIDTLFAMDAHIIMTFVLAGIALNLTPGADVMFTIATALRGGEMAGVAAAAGIASASLVHVALTALGIAALLAAHDGLNKDESDAMNARLILILANHIGDAAVLEAALEAAKQ